MALFHITEKTSGKQFGVYKVRIDKNDALLDVTGQPSIDTYFLIYRNDTWVWLTSREVEPFEMDGLFDE